MELDFTCDRCAKDTMAAQRTLNNEERGEGMSFFHICSYKLIRKLKGRSFLGYVYACKCGEQFLTNRVGDRINVDHVYDLKVLWEVKE